MFCLSYEFKEKIITQKTTNNFSMYKKNGEVNDKVLCNISKYFKFFNWIINFYYFQPSKQKAMTCGIFAIYEILV